MLCWWRTLEYILTLKLKECARQCSNWRELVGLQFYKGLSLWVTDLKMMLNINNIVWCKIQLLWRRNLLTASFTHLLWSYTVLRNQWPRVHYQPQIWCTSTSHWSGHMTGFPARSSDQLWERNQRDHRGLQCGRTYTPRRARWNTSHQRTGRCTAEERLQQAKRLREGEVNSRRSGKWYCKDAKKQNKIRSHLL